jgi:hypothetical protein
VNYLVADKAEDILPTLQAAAAATSEVEKEMKTADVEQL